MTFILTSIKLGQPSKYVTQNMFIFSASNLIF